MGDHFPRLVRAQNARQYRLDRRLRRRPQVDFPNGNVDARCFHTGFEFQASEYVRFVLFEPGFQIRRDYSSRPNLQVGTFGSNRGATGVNGFD